MFENNFNTSELLANALLQIDGMIAETELELKKTIDSCNNEIKNKIKNLLNELIEVTDNNDVDLYDNEIKKTILIWLMKLKINQKILNGVVKENLEDDQINTHILKSELSMLKIHLESQQDNIKEYKVKITELNAQLAISENLYQQALTQKCKVEEEKTNLLNELSRIKTINDNKICLLESKISFFKKTLLERETEIASLKLSLAKLVRITNNLFNESDLDHIKILSESTESLSKKSQESGKNLSDKPPIVPRTHFNSQSQFKDSSLTGSFTMPFSSLTSSNKLIRTKNNLNDQIYKTQFNRIKSFTPILYDRCFSPINRFDLATNNEQLERFHLQHSLNYQNNFNDNNINLQNSSLSSNSSQNKSIKSSCSSSPYQFHNLVSNNINTLPKLTDQGKKKNFNANNFNLNINENYASNPDFDHHYKNFKNLYNSSFIINKNNHIFSCNNNKEILSTRPNSFSDGLNNYKNTLVTIGKNPFFWFKKASRSFSAPELVDDTKLTQLINLKNSNPELVKNGNINDYSNIKESKSKGIKRFFEKITNRNQFSQDSLSFRRSSLRATIGPQVRTQQQKFGLNQNFSSWNFSLLSDWFKLIGLGNYSENIIRSMYTGEHLCNASDSQLEKELGIKNYFHRKKLRLTIQCVNNTADELTKCAGKLDYLWVAKWLDDIGLPQYKEVFLENRIDGAVLHHLTIDDLLRLKIIAQLHHSSIKWSIFVLRKHKFNSNCLKRRSTPKKTNQNVLKINGNMLCNTLNENNADLDDQMNHLKLDTRLVYSTSEITLWTCHRIMEWLRSIDLSEYIANLRGSGVHGALIVYEDAFNCDVFSLILSIAPNKTLLRRHMSTHFNQLIGIDISQRKKIFQDKENNAFISAFAKVKIPKKSNFKNSFKKKKSEIVEEFVCPILPPEEYTNYNDLFLNNKFSSMKGTYFVNLNKSNNYLEENNEITKNNEQNQLINEKKDKNYSIDDYDSDSSRRLHQMQTPESHV